MKILINSFAILVAAAIGLGVGFLLRGKPKHKELIIAESEGQTIAQRLGALRRQPVPRIDDSPLATKLARDLSMSSGVTRWLYWLEALDKAQPADFPRLVRLAQTNDTALRFVTARWVEVAPRHMFDTIVASYKNPQGLPVDQLANTLFSEWPKRDPDGAIAALNEAGDSSDQFQTLVRHAREMHDLLLEHLIAAEPSTAQYARGLADSMANHLDEMERLLDRDALHGAGSAKSH